MTNLVQGTCDAANGKIVFSKTLEAGWELFFLSPDHTPLASSAVLTA